MPARYHLIGALVIDRHAANACVYRRSRADCNELISAAGRGSAIFLPFTLFSAFSNSATDFVSAENSRERSGYIMERERGKLGCRGRGFQLVDSLTVQR